MMKINFKKKDPLISAGFLMVNSNYNKPILKRNNFY